MVKRKIVEIDEAKCNGCGLCTTACAEGAIEIVDGKAKLISEIYCDGLGACLGECPEDAIQIIEREAESFDEEAVERHLNASQGVAREVAAAENPLPCGCPGSAVQSLQLDVLPSHATVDPKTPQEAGSTASALSHWPIQLHLVPPNAPFLREADLLLVADCVPFAMADFHGQFLKEHPLVIGCPKLDDGRAYVAKLAAMLEQSAIRSLTVLHMEVPCCTGLVRIARAAIEESKRSVPLEEVTISIRGRVLSPDGEAG